MSDKWISASCPPKEREIVIVLLNGRYCRTGSYARGKWYHHAGIFMSKMVKGEFRVTHWMPIPIPAED